MLLLQTVTFISSNLPLIIQDKPICIQKIYVKRLFCLMKASYVSQLSLYISGTIAKIANKLIVKASLVLNFTSGTYKITVTEAGHQQLHHPILAYITTPISAFCSEHYIGRL